MIMRIDKFNTFEGQKPGPKMEPKLDYDEMMDFLENKYNFQSRGFTGIPSTMDYSNHFDNWCDKQGLPQKDKKGNYRISSQIFYKMYQEAEDGEKEKPPYMDFWHYLCDVCEPHNGSYIWIPKEASVDSWEEKHKQRLEMYNDLKKQYKNDKKILQDIDIIISKEKDSKKGPWEGWQQQITDLIFKEFGEYSDGDDLRVWVEW